MGKFCTLECKVSEETDAEKSQGKVWSKVDSKDLPMAERPTYRDAPMRCTFGATGGIRPTGAEGVCTDRAGQGTTNLQGMASD